VKEITIVHLGDLHFGKDVDLKQIAALEDFVARTKPDVVCVTGDVTQRARVGELQRALAFVQSMERHAPVHVIPGNHDVQWWKAILPFTKALGRWTKYRAVFGEELAPVLATPRFVVAGLLTSFGLAWKSLTFNPRDMTVKGHLSKQEVTRVKTVFGGAPHEAVRIATLHHNVLRGEISNRMGLSRWRTAQQRLLGIGADVILCAHDHQEGAGQIDGVLPVSTTGTHTSRTRGKRPSAFNVVTVDGQAVHIRHHRWDPQAWQFQPSTESVYARHRHHVDDPLPVAG
jgi:3',5'-cyclic AMP phosphodiesterase CpdA